MLVKLLSFKFGGQTLFGPKVKREEAVWDVLAIAAEYEAVDFPKTIIDGVASGLDFVEKMRKLVERAEQDESSDRFKYKFNEIEWLSPIPRTPKNVICVGKNYADHVTEMGGEAPPEKLMIFTKARLQLPRIEPGFTDYAYADVTVNLDYEGELAVVISKEGKNIPKAFA